MKRIIVTCEVQAEHEEEMVPGEVVEGVLENVLTNVFWPFLKQEQMGVREALAEETPGMEWSVISTEREQFGEAEAEVTRLQVDVGAPLTPEDEEGILVWGVADFDGEFQMSSEWTVEEEFAEEHEGTMGIAFNLIEVMPR